MDVKNILIMVAVIVLLYIVIAYFLKDSNTMSGLMSGTSSQQIAASTLAKDPSGLNQANFAYSIWYYIDDWNYNYNAPKILFARSHPINTSVTVDDGAISMSNPCPLVSFSPDVNNLDVYLAIEQVSSNSHSDFKKCTVENVPIQKWTNVIISVYGRSLDIYLDGKLIKTCPLSNTVLVDPTTNVTVTPNGGFSGWTSKFAYYPNALNPQQVWDIYSAGYGASWLSNIFGQYTMQVSFLENGVENSSFTI